MAVPSLILHLGIICPTMGLSAKLRDKNKIEDKKNLKYKKFKREGA